MEATIDRQGAVLAEHHLEIGVFRCYTNVIVGEFFEGVHVTKANALLPIQLAQRIYGDTRPFIYISHRLHSYSMDPVGYGEVVNMFPNFRGIAIVSENKYRRMLANLEKLFIKKPMAVFYTLDDAFAWADELLKMGEPKTEGVLKFLS